MASIQRRLIHGRPYYYLVESRRVNGKPRPVIVKYLGRAEALLERLAEADRKALPSEAEVTDFGAVAALWDLAGRIDLAATIDRHVPKRDQGATVGTYLTLAAINRCVATTSKTAFAGWYRKTALARLVPIAMPLLSGQRFWDAMSAVSSEAIRAIEAELSARVVRDFNVDLRALCFDCTNFDTYVDSASAATLPQRGHAKSKRTDLRVVGLALLVTADGELPLFSQVYPGNQPDSVTFASVTAELVARYRLLAKETEHVTLVFDKGNNSEENIEELMPDPEHGRRAYHVIGSLVPSQHQDLLAVPLREFSPVQDPRLARVQAYRTKKTVFDREWTVVVTRSETLLKGQLRGIAQVLAKRRRALAALQVKLARSQRVGAKGKGYTRESLEAHATELKRSQYVKDILDAHVTAKRGKLRLSYRTDPHALDRLRRTVLGKRIIFTDNHDWSTAEIVLGYRSQYHVEAAFRQMKDPAYVSFRPVRHWTDQKIEVHAFYCVLALLLASLLRREVGRKGIRLTIDALLDQLHGIQEVVNLYAPSGVRGGRPQARRVLTRRTRLQEQLYRLLDLDRYRAS
jgi:transposase